jgi:hypothetical protein
MGERQACPRLYSRITRIRTREIRIPTDHSLWVTHGRSLKLAVGHSRSRGKADFTSTRNPGIRHCGLVVRAAHSFLFRAVCAPWEFHQHPPLLAQPLISTRRSSLHTCFVIVCCPFVIVPWRLIFIFTPLHFLLIPLLFSLAFHTCYR